MAAPARQTAPGPPCTLVHSAAALASFGDSVQAPGRLTSPAPIDSCFGGHAACIRFP
jgi:hypothetical protein